MKTITLEWTTNHAPVDLEATLAHHNICARVEPQRSWPTKVVKLTYLAESQVDLQALLNANNISEK